MKLAVRPIVIAAFVSLSGLPALSQVDNPSDRRLVDLDGASPDEMLQNTADGQRLLFWSEPDTVWVEVFRAPSVEGLVDDPRSYFKRIVSGGRQWQWRNEGFVPLLSAPAVVSGSANDEDFNAAVAALSGDLAEAPENSAANMVYQFIAPDGHTFKAVQLATTSLCMKGGSVCPLVVIQSGREPVIHLNDLSQDWGFHYENGRTFVEFQSQTSILQIDLDGGAQRQLSMIAPVAAPDPPRHPRLRE